MSIYLFQSKNSGCLNYSTADNNNNNNTSREFSQYRPEKSKIIVQARAFNMNDKQKRIKRNHSALLQKSVQQRPLFSAGLKKIKLKAAEIPEAKGIYRSYHNKQSYNILNPKPAQEIKGIQSGIKSIYLYDQRRQTSQDFQKSESKKKMLKHHNSQSDNEDSSRLFLVKKLETSKSNILDWHNQLTKVEFKKKQNVLNKENVLGNGETEKVPCKLKLNIKNKSTIKMEEGVVTAEVGKGCDIDFKQNYYQRKEKKKIEGRVPGCHPKVEPYKGFLTHR